MKKTIRILAWVLTLIMAGTAFCTVGYAATSAWNGTDTATAFAGGSGTEEDPYLIADAAQLAFLATTTNAKTADYTGVFFKQTADIDLGEKSWTPIGGSGASFKGNYDGDNHKITGLKCDTIALDGDAKNYAGLFGNASGATIQNLNVSGSMVRSNNYSGAILGYGRNLVTIFNCTSNIDHIDGAQVGGIVGRLDFQEFNSDDRNMVIACVSDSNIRTTGNVSVKEDGSTGRSYTYVGGIIGSSIATTVAYCTNNGTLDLIPLLNRAYPIWSGGIAGVNGSSLYKSNIYFCTNHGNIKTYTSYDVSEILSQPAGTTIHHYENVMRLGGIAGHFTNKIENNIMAGCLNTGKVTIYKSSAADAQIMDTSESETQRAGGLIGLANKSCITTHNYSTMTPGIAVDKSGSDVETNVTVVTVDALKGEAGLTAMNRGDTFEEFVEILVAHSLKNSFYTQNEIKEMEKLTDGKTMNEYMVARIQNELAEQKTVIESVWSTRLNTEPVVSEPSRAWTVTGLFAMIQKSVDTALDKLMDGDIGGSGENPGGNENPDGNNTDSNNGNDTTNENSGTSASTEKPSDSNSNNNKEEKKGGCSSSVLSVSTALLVLATSGAVVTFRKRRQD